MKHDSLARFKLSHLWMVQACLFLAGAQTGAHQANAARPSTLGSLRQQVYGKQSQRKQLFTATDSGSAPLFLEAPEYATGLIPYSVAVADFNADGKDDVAVADFCADNVSCAQMGPSSVSVLLGNGDGTFHAHVDYLTAVGSTSVAIGDFNNDGKKDVVVSNICSDSSCVGSSVSILLGRGDGTFQPHVDYATGPGALAVAVGDLNGDGKPDLVTADYFDAASVLLGTASTIHVACEVRKQRQLIQGRPSLRAAGLMCRDRMLLSRMGAPVLTDWNTRSSGRSDFTTL